MLPFPLPYQGDRPVGGLSGGDPSLQSRHQPPGLGSFITGAQWRSWLTPLPLSPLLGHAASVSLLSTMYSSSLVSLLLAENNFPDTHPPRPPPSSQLQGPAGTTSLLPTLSWVLRPTPNPSAFSVGGLGNTLLAGSGARALPQLPVSSRSPEASPPHPAPVSPPPAG